MTGIKEFFAKLGIDIDEERRRRDIDKAEEEEAMKRFCYECNNNFVVSRTLYGGEGESRQIDEPCRCASEEWHVKKKEESGQITAESWRAAWAEHVQRFPQSAPHEAVYKRTAQLMCEDAARNGEPMPTIQSTLEPARKAEKTVADLGADMIRSVIYGDADRAIRHAFARDIAEAHNKIVFDAAAAMEIAVQPWTDALRPDEVKTFLDKHGETCVTVQRVAPDELHIKVIVKTGQEE